MDIRTMTQAAAKAAKAAQEAVPAQSGAGVRLPSEAPDPVAVADFKEAMHGPQGAEFEARRIEGVEARAEPGLAGGAGTDAVEEAGGLQTYAAMMQVLSKDQLSHADLYRVQVMGAMASIEAQRNSSAAGAMDRGLKTILKDAG